MKLTPSIRQLSIQQKNMAITRLETNWAQQQFLDTLEKQYSVRQPGRVIVLKARQLGISTLCEAVAFQLSFVFPGLQSLVVAHETNASEYLLGMTRRYWETYPYRELYKSRYVSKTHLAWDNGSSIAVQTAKNVHGGRSRTINLLHASEVAFWDEPEQKMLGLRQAIPDMYPSTILLESTANGVGNWFYKMWHDAVAGDNEYTPLFFPWWEHPEYSADQIGLPYKKLGTLDDDEKFLRDKFDLPDERLAWRRWAVIEKCNKDITQFKQEYPATAEEAFVASGSNVFPIESLRKCYEPMDGIRGRLIINPKNQKAEFQPDITGPLTVFLEPSDDTDWGQYFIGADPALTGGVDHAVAQVINRRTWEQAAIWRGKLDAGTFAHELMALGKYYNTATIAPETTGAGQATIAILLEHNYPNLWRHTWADREHGKPSTTYGWDTSEKRKEWAIGWLLKLVIDQDIRIHDPVTFQEMRDFVRLQHGRLSHPDKKHDDTVMALAIATVCNSSEQLSAYGINTPQIGPPEWELWTQDITTGN